MTSNSQQSNSASDQPSRKRRFARISLRTLLLLMVVFACFFAFVMVPAYQQKVARKWVDSQRGDYGFDRPIEIEKEGFHRVGRLPVPHWALDWFGIDYFANVNVVHLGTDEIYNLYPLAGFSKLEEIYINQFIHEEVDFSVLQSIKRLRKIELTKWSGVDRKQLEMIAELVPNVEIVAEEFPDFQLEPRK